MTATTKLVRPTTLETAPAVPTARWATALDRAARRLAGPVRRDPLPVLATLVLAAAFLSVITATPWRLDDTFNNQVRGLVIASHTDIVSYAWSQIVKWMNTEGRFYPGSLSWTYGMFWLFGATRVVYKIVIAVIAIAAAGVLGRLCTVVTGSRAVGWLFGSVVFGFLQIRDWQDGLTSYAALLSLTTALTALAVLILTTRSGVVWSVVAGLAFAFAITTYETVALFLPALALIVWFRRRRWLPLLPLAIPVAAEFAIIAVLRPAAAATEGVGYTLNLAPGPLTLASLEQATAAIPLSQWFFAPNMTAIGSSTFVIAALVAGLPAGLIAVFAARAVVEQAPRDLWLLAVLGAWMWISSSVLVGATVRWQQDLYFGQGYLAVIYGYFGLALMTVAAIVVLLRLTVRTRPAWAVHAPLVVGLAVAVIATFTLAGNLTIASKW